MSQGRNFASDNTAPIAPEVMAAILAASRGAAASYGGDAETERVRRLAREVFETEVEIVPVSTGTAANSLALASIAPPYGAIYCHETAHVLLEEGGGPEFYTGGAKLIGLPGAAGKLAPERLGEALALAEAAGVHHAKPAALSLTQATEWGTVYRPDEIRALAERARGHGLRLHMDGARLANAVARLGCRPADVTWRAGVDILSLGLTKNGAMAAEAVVVFDPALAIGLAERRKRGGHLLSKMRFLSAQLAAMLEDGLWLRHAAHANAMADRLATALGRVPGLAACGAGRGQRVVRGDARAADRRRSSTRTSCSTAGSSRPASRVRWSAWSPASPLCPRTWTRSAPPRPDWPLRESG